MLDGAERQKWARDMVRASRPKDDLADPRDVLGEFDRKIVGAASVTIKLPLRDPVEVRRHLEMIEEACRVLRLQLEQHAKDRTHLFTVRGVMRLLHQRINAYRTPRRD